MAIAPARDLFAKKRVALGGLAAGSSLQRQARQDRRCLKLMRIVTAFERHDDLSMIVLPGQRLTAIDFAWVNTYTIVRREINLFSLFFCAFDP